MAYAPGRDNIVELETDFMTSPEEVYDAWLDCDHHERISGKRAEIEPRVGGRFSLEDGYVRGECQSLEPGKRIVQTWRDDDFPDTVDDSILEMRLEPLGDGTRMTVRHSNLPDGDLDRHRKRWQDNYITPMKEALGR